MGRDRFCPLHLVRIFGGLDLVSMQYALHFLGIRGACFPHLCFAIIILSSSTGLHLS